MLKQGIPNEEATYFIELWDISGNQAHKNSRSVYYKGVNVYILSFSK